MTLFLCLIGIAYLFGAIPFALIIAKMLRGIDIREHGSGNVGATNVSRVIGYKAGFLCLAFDFLKGYLPTLAAWYLIREPLDLGIMCSPAMQILLVGITTVIGHCFPIYLMGIGGKGVATSLGVFTALMPFPILICVAVGLTYIWLYGYVAIASCMCATALPFLAFMFNYSPEYIVVTALLAVVIDLRHLGNIRRFLRGVEPKIWEKKTAPAVDEGVGGKG